ncbi:MAG: hypothetical protein ACYDB7_12275, partial [Mycobacteriales bacterium]
MRGGQAYPAGCVNTLRGRLVFVEYAVELILRLARENPGLGLPAHRRRAGRVRRQRVVHLIGVTASPNGPCVTKGTATSPPTSRRQ